MSTLNREKTSGENCTCTGGPYQHGPQGRDQVLAQARQQTPPQPEPQDGGK